MLCFSIQKMAKIWSKNMRKEWKPVDSLSQNFAHFKHVDLILAENSSQRRIAHDFALENE